MARDGAAQLFHTTNRLHKLPKNANFVIILSIVSKTVLFILTSLWSYYPNECCIYCLKLPLNIQQIVITMIVEISNNFPILNANLV